MNGIRAFTQHLSVDDEPGTSADRETRGRCWIGVTLPATDDYGRRHGAKRAGAIEISRQNVNQSFAPQLRISYCEDVERRDSNEGGVELDGRPQASDQRTPQQQHTQDRELGPQSQYWVSALVCRDGVKRLQEQAIHDATLRHPCGRVGSGLLLRNVV